jgi:hypothetical protein
VRSDTKFQKAIDVTTKEKKEAVDMLSLKAHEK